MTHASSSPALERREIGRTDGTAIAIAGLTKHFPVPRRLAEIARRPMQRRFLTALRKITLEVHPGEFFGLLGPNGAGKTTLFKILSGLIVPDHGSAHIGGTNIAQDPAAVRRILTPVISDERSLRWRLSARENLSLFAHLYGVPPGHVTTRVDAALETVMLTDTDGRMVGTFSSGMKQRLAIARALLSRPKIILLDEPTRSLDPLAARSLRTFLRDDLCRRQHTTVLLATHNTEEAFELCDRVGILHRGRLLASGPTERLTRQFGDERYRFWIRDPNRAVLSLLDGLRAQVAEQPNADGWWPIEIDVPDGPAQAANILGQLVSGGVAVSRFERIALTLAELIERVVAGTASINDG